jgi:gas vesicle protein
MTDVWKQQAICGDLVHAMLSDFYESKTDNGRRFSNLSNGELKQKMPEYIEYIVTFYDNAAEDIATKMTSVGDALTNAINKINPNNQAEVQQVQQEIQSNPEGTPVDSNSTNTQQTTTPATTPEQSNAVATGAPAAQPVAASGNDYVDGYAYLESFIDLFMEDEDRRVVAALFNTTVGELTDNMDLSKALKETLLRIKKHSLELAQKNGADLKSLVEGKKKLQRLERLEFSL